MTANADSASQPPGLAADRDHLAAGHLVGRNPAEPAECLRRLRGEFPHWGFVHNPFAPRWTAVYGKRVTVHAGTAFELADRLKRGGAA